MIINSLIWQLNGYLARPLDTNVCEAGDLFPIPRADLPGNPEGGPVKPVPSLSCWLEPTVPPTLEHHLPETARRLVTCHCQVPSPRTQKVRWDDLGSLRGLYAGGLEELGSSEEEGWQQVKERLLLM